MVRHLGRVAPLALVVIVLASILTTIPGASAASPSYTLTGFISAPQGRDISNVQVDLISQATGAVFTTLTDSSSQFAFTTSSTSGALVPGYWGLSVPAQPNSTVYVYSSGVPTKVSPAAVLPEDQNPVFGFYTANTAGTLLPPSGATPSLNVTVYGYGVTVKGTVKLAGGGVVTDAIVDVLAPQYNGVILYNTTSNATTGNFTLKAPPGSWVLQSVDLLSNFENTTNISSSGGTIVVNPVVNSYIVTGQMLALNGGPIGNPGNATLFDPNPATTGIYSTSTSNSGKYVLGTYGKNFGGSAGTFDLFLASKGNATVEHTLSTLGSTTPVTYSPRLPALLPSQRGNYTTTLDFTGFNNATGTGNLTVNTTAILGNDSVVPNLPNSTVAQLWSQLGLDFNHTISIPSSLLSTFYTWVNASGPFFPAVQANTTINGTGFVPPTHTQSFGKVISTCGSTYCGPSTSGGLTFNWSNRYALNGTVRADSSLYSIGFGFEHPSASSDIFNYTVVLPRGYVLKAGTAAPANSKLIPLGPDNTWGSFTLESLYDTSPAGSLGFTIVSATTIAAVVNATVPSYFAFSNQNVLNSTRGNYTVEVGVNQNVTFTAANSIYPTGIAGSKFVWTFGDGTGVNVTTGTTGATYHYYKTATSGNTPYKGTLKVIGTNNYNDTTSFYVWVASGPLTAGIDSNATSSENRTVGGSPYLFINWGTTLYFNATASKAVVTPTTTAVKGVVAVASYSLVSKGFSQSANYSESAGAYYGANYSYQFLGAGSYLTNGTVRGNLVPFKGWQYNLTLKVWSGTGQTNTTTLVILVNDTEKPTAAFTILNSAGTPISGKSVVAQSNLSAQIQLNAANSTDPHNGSIVRYYWLIGQTGNGSFRKATNVTTVKPYPKFWLAAAVQSYWVNLTVFDRNGNPGYTNQTLNVAANSTTTPILATNNITGPTKINEGSSYTYWVNVTVGGGTKSTAQSIEVTWYITSPGGTARTYIAGSPGSVTFYNYTSKGVVNPISMTTGSIASLPYNTTVRAVIHWTPGSTGNFQLYANATASNEFVGDYSSATNVASMSITVSPNPTTQLLEYVAIAAAVIVAIALIILYVRRRGGRGKASKSTSGRSGLERGGKRAEDEDEEEESS